jgi:hypothetical protein
LSVSRITDENASDIKFRFLIPQVKVHRVVPRNSKAILIVPDRLMSVAGLRAPILTMFFLHLPLRWLCLVRDMVSHGDRMPSVLPGYRPCLLLPLWHLKPLSRPFRSTMCPIRVAIMISTLSVPVRIRPSSNRGIRDSLSHLRFLRLLKTTRRGSLERTKTHRVNTRSVSICGRSVGRL